jgi:cytochrome c biogenesis protein CcmG/thiol:disulfide interchange protein DsbE
MNPGQPAPKDAGRSERATLLLILACLAALALLVLGLLILPRGSAEDDAGSGPGNPRSELSVEEATAPLSDAPPALAALRTDANRILGGGLGALRARLRELRGTPVVINKWASWCGPCRFEFPHLQAQATERAREVAFLGLNTTDSRAAAEDFLQQLPLPYPSYEDPDGKLARALDLGREFPATLFLDSRGKVAHVKLGAYPDAAALAADIERYAR